MKKTIMLLKKMGLGRVRKDAVDEPFEKRLKKVNDELFMTPTAIHRQTLTRDVVAEIAR